VFDISVAVEKDVPILAEAEGIDSTDFVVDRIVELSEPTLVEGTKIELSGEVADERTGGTCVVEFAKGGIIGARELLDLMRLTTAVVSTVGNVPVPTMFIEDLRNCLALTKIKTSTSQRS
jgi:hypothetical protein